MSIDIKLPELGEGIDSGDILEVLVREGDVIKKDQGLVELETDKATVEVPSSHAGKVVKVHVQQGQTIKIGANLISLEPATSAAAPSKTSPTPPATKSAPAASPAKTESKPSPAPTSKPSTPAPKQEKPAPPVTKPREPAAAPPPEPAPVADQSAAASTVAAGPAVRRFAREVGVDLAQVMGSGEGGRITREDVLAVVRQTSVAARTPGTATEEEATEKDAWGPVRIEKMSKIRRTIAAKMHESWTTAPRVTNFDDADVTELERIRESSKADYAAKDIKLTAMPFVIKAVAMALREHRAVNASLDMETEQIIYKHYVNIGVAVDTERGLVVPSLRGADKLSIAEIARHLASIANKVRSGDFSLDDLRGGTFTISNLGAIGGTYSTPIINVPEVAILLLGRSRKMPVVIGDEIKIRLMMPLSLSYDHRLVDGATAARFLNEVIGYLEAPGRLLLAP